MWKRTIGLFASLALLSSGAAFAIGDHHKDKKVQSSEQVGKEAMGGSGVQQQGTAKLIQMHGQVQGDREITGTVVKSSNSELKLRTDNGIISMTVNKNTQFQDATLKQGKDLKEGQQVRTSFSVEKDTNIARSIRLDTDIGGSGLDSDVGIHQDLGGSGLDQGLDHNMGGSGDVTGAERGSGHESGKTY